MENRCHQCGSPLNGETEVFIDLTRGMRSYGTCSAPDGVDPAQYWADATPELGDEIIPSISLSYSVRERRTVGEVPIRHYRWVKTSGGRGVSPYEGWGMGCLHNVPPCPKCGVIGGGHKYWCPIELKAAEERRLRNYR